MSTVFDVRNLPKFARTSVMIGSLAVVFALIAAVAGAQIYRTVTNNTVVAYFSEANALYVGDNVQIMGVRVGAIDKVEPAGDKMKVTFHYQAKYKVPADGYAVILNPTLVASRNIQLGPPYTDGPVLGDNAVIPIERTQVPVEWDDFREQISDIITKLGPTPHQPKGPFGDLIESFADGLAGKGKEINTALSSLGRALTALNEGRGDLFAVLRSLALFVNALHNSDQKFVALNNGLAQLTDSFTGSDRDVANALEQTDSLLAKTRKFFDENGSVLTHDVDNLAKVTTALLQPTPRNGLETALHVGPTFSDNASAIYAPAHGGIVGLLAFQNFANPLNFICSAIQAGSRLGYQDSAELCAQYLAPVLDAIKFNYLPFGANLFSSAQALPKHLSYTEDRLRPPSGYKATTVPGVFAPDTLFSFGNHEPGWIAAPGMQGVQVGPATQNMLTPDSLAELMGGPDIMPPPPGQRQPGPPNAYDQNNPLPPPWYPQPLPSPTPAPPGPPAPPLAAEAPAPTGPHQ